MITSATKYLNGHSDVIAGAVAGSASFVEEVTALMRLWGQAIDPHAAWLVDRGMRTLAVRMERHNANGLAVAEWAESMPAIRQGPLSRAGRPTRTTSSRPSCWTATAAWSGSSSPAGPRRPHRLLTRLKLVIHAPSLAGVESLVSRAAAHLAQGLSAEQRAALGIPDGFLRLSCGIEDADDIIGPGAGWSRQARLLGNAAPSARLADSLPLPP